MIPGKVISILSFKHFGAGSIIVNVGVAPTVIVVVKLSLQREVPNIVTKHVIGKVPATLGTIIKLSVLDNSALVVAFIHV